MNALPEDDDLIGAWCCALELSDGGVSAASEPPPGRRRARVLVRLHGEPLGYVLGSVEGGGLDSRAVADRAREAFGTHLTQHLRAEGLASGDDVPAATASCPTAPVTDHSVSVVVCTRDRAVQLAGCLEHLLRLTYPRLDIVVVDNAPRDDATQRLVLEAAGRDQRVSYVVEPRPGLSAARNRGWSAARGDVVAYTDDDCWVDPAWVHGVVRGFRRRPDVACVTGLVTTASITSPAEVYFDARTTSWSARMSPDLFDLSQRGERGPLYPYSAGIFGTGANLALRRSALQDLGGFDEALGAGTATNGGEDLDMFVRVLRAGHAIAYEPSALVWHHHRADQDALRRQMFGYGTGLGAFVTKLLLDPATRPEVTRRALHGARRVLAIRAETSRREAPGVRRPAGVASRELLGLAAGPLRYRSAVRASRAPRPS